MNLIYSLVLVITFTGADGKPKEETTAMNGWDDCTTAAKLIEKHAPGKRADCRVSFSDETVRG